MNLKRLVVFVLIAVLIACSPTPKPVPVTTPIYRSPLEGVALPVPLAPLGSRPPDVRAALEVALAQLCRSYAYMAAADPLLRLSAGLEPGPLLIYPECIKD